MTRINHRGNGFIAAASLVLVLASLLVVTPGCSGCGRKAPSLDPSPDATTSPKFATAAPGVENDGGQAPDEAPNSVPEAGLHDPCMDCSDSNDPTSCRPRSSGSACETDMAPCLTQEICVHCATLGRDENCSPSNRVCHGASIVDCPDDNPCVDARLVIEGDICRCEETINPNATPCDDHMGICTTDKHCQDGLCLGTPVAIENDYPCIEKVCLPGKGIVNRPLDGAPCDDGLACTTGDSCHDGICRGDLLEALPVPCKQAACDSDIGTLVYEPAGNGAICDDGNPCTDGDICDAGECVGGPPVECDDGNPCTKDLCDLETGACRHDSADGASCDLAGQPCVEDGVCIATECVPDGFAADGSLCDHPDGLPGVCLGGQCQDPCVDRECGESGWGWNCGTCDEDPLAPLCSETGRCVGDMVAVPGGTFRRGSSFKSPDGPPHEATLTHDFRIDRYPITWAMYARFLRNHGLYDSAERPLLDCEDGGARIECTPDFPVAEGFDDHPAVEMSWYGAEAYCSWAGKRLCHEAEIDRAGQGTDGRPYPWGWTWLNPPACNCKSSDTKCQDGYQETSPVTAHPEGATPEGTEGLVGNAKTWTADWYGCLCAPSIDPTNGFCPGVAACTEVVTVDPVGPCPGEATCESTIYKVIRGSSWKDVSWVATTAFRDVALPDTTDSGLGFRCCADL